MAGDAGEFVAALAECQLPTHPGVLGYINRKGSNYYTVRDIVDADEDMVIPKGTQIGPKGQKSFTDWLEGKERGGHAKAEGKELAEHLKRMCWKDLQALVGGNADLGINAIGAEGVAEELSGWGSRRAASAGSGQDGEIARSQGKTLRMLAKELRAGNGAQPNSLRV
jgi:hypothetical protein